MVRSKAADLGQYVNPGTMLGITFATDYAEVRLPLTDQDLAFVDLPDAADVRKTGAVDGPLVSLSAVQKGKMRFWNARIVRTEGVVDEKNRVTYVVAGITDPYLLKVNSGEITSLPMGTFVTASIEGMTVDNVIRVPRAALRGNQIVIPSVVTVMFNLLSRSTPSALVRWVIKSETKLMESRLTKSCSRAYSCTWATVT